MAGSRPPSPHSTLITGGGIGAALARRYPTPGTQLALGGRDPGRLATIAAECRQAGANVRLLATLPANLAARLTARPPDKA